MDSSNLLLTPSAKKNKDCPREYPFPIVTSSVEYVEDNVKEGETDTKWTCFTGHLQNNYVLVHDKEAMRSLYCQGYFGKGTLSKNAPDVFLRNRRAHRRQFINIFGESWNDNSIIDVIDSDDGNEGPPLKREKLSDDVDVVDDDPWGPDSPPANEIESLQLSLEEAFFLSYGLGCLVVMEKDQPMSIARLWNRFCELTPNDSFPIKYTAYHHFRSKGWIVKSGLKYGTDFLLYKDGPPFYHSTYSVIVKGVKEQNLRDMRGNPQFTWSSLAALNRVNSTAGKALMFLYVIKPSTISDAKISTPYCVQQFKLEEVIFKRWVPSENREEND